MGNIRQRLLLPLFHHMAVGCRRDCKSSYARHGKRFQKQLGSSKHNLADFQDWKYIYFGHDMLRNRRFWGRIAYPFPQLVDIGDLPLALHKTAKRILTRPALDLFFIPLV